MGKGIAMLSLQKMKSAFTGFKVNEDGNIAIITAVSGVALLAMTSLGVDMMGARSSQQELQSHLDVVSMALATSGITGTEAQKTFAQDLMLANGYDLDPANLTIQMTSAGEIQVTGHTTHKLSFGAVFNKDTVEVSAQSSAVAATGSVSDPTDIVLVLDTTKSMEGAKLAALKSSANKLIDAMSGSGSSQVQIGVVPFAAYVNVGLQNRNESWLDLQPEKSVTTTEYEQILVTPGYCRGNPNATLTKYNDGVPETYIGCDDYVDDVYKDGNPITVTKEEKWHGCVLSRSRGSGYTSTLHLHDQEWLTEPVSTLNRNDWMCGSPLLPLTSNFSEAKASINGIVANWDTYMPAGIAWGWRVLTPNEPFTGGRSNSKQVMVIMTDGVNSMYKGEGRTHPRIEQGTADGVTQLARTNQDVSTLCQNVKNDNIEVYTIAFEVNDFNTKNLLRSCADSTANYFDAQNTQELEDAFLEIADSITDGVQPRLTR